MKKKSLILLASSIAGMALIGGTFAAWAVTDNAKQVTIKVSPGTVETDNTSYVTMEWGTSQQLNNVGQLAAGETRKVGVLDLRANTQSTDALTGALTRTISYTGETATYKLSTKLTINIYEGDISAPAGTPISFTNNVHDVVLTVDQYTNNVLTSEGNRNKPILFSVFASLPEMTASEYANYQTQSATITFDWGVASGTQTVNPANYTTYYASGFEAADTVYCYAWKSGAENAQWPGVKMEAANISGFFSVQVDNGKGYEKVIFSNGTDARKSADLVISTVFTSGKNWFKYTGSGDLKGDVGTHDDTVSVNYYLVGENFSIGSKAYTHESGWNPYDEGKFTLTNGVGTIEITTTGGAQLKVFEVASNTWYSNDGNNFIIHDEGTYTIQFNLNSNTPIACI